MKHLECKTKKGRGILVACAVGFGLTISMAASVGLRADAAARRNSHGQPDHRVTGVEQALATTLPKFGYFSFDGADASSQDGKERTQDDIRAAASQSNGIDPTPNRIHGVSPETRVKFDVTNSLGLDAG